MNVWSWAVVATILVGGAILVGAGIWLSRRAQRQVDVAATGRADDQAAAARAAAGEKAARLEDLEALEEARKPFGQRRREPPHS